MRKAKVILLSVFAAISHGIIHDQITAHLCVEYFSVAHPRRFPTEPPTLLAFCWGVFATVGLGAVLGAILADVSQSTGLSLHCASYLVGFTGGAFLILRIWNQKGRPRIIALGLIVEEFAALSAR